MFIDGLFWGSACVLGFTFLGYPLLVRLLAALYAMPIPRSPLTFAPSISVLLVVRNEERHIRQRLENLLSLVYPSDSWEIIVVSDASTDRTDAIVHTFPHSRIRLSVQREPAGKPACINDGIAKATGDIIIFCDARQQFDSQAIVRLVSRFSDPAVGAVSGALVIATGTRASGRGEAVYWDMEKWIRYHESRFSSSIGCTGAIYAARRCLVQPLPADTLIDDLVIPMTVAASGYRVVFEPSALAYDPLPLDPHTEFIRKRRTMAGNFQVLFRYPRWLCPWAHPLWWQLIAHKYLRLLSPIFLLSLLVSSFLLRSHSGYASMLTLQVIFYSLALMGLLIPRLQTPVFNLPAGFLFLNLMPILGFWQYLVGARRAGWK